MTVRCAACGKFISYKDIEEDNVDFYYIPDSYLTREELCYEHKECGKVAEMA